MRKLAAVVGVLLCTLTALSVDAYTPGREGTYIDGSRTGNALECIVRGKILIGMADAGYQGDFGSFDRVRGRLHIGAARSAAEAQGEIHIEIDSWESRLPSVDDRIRRSFFHSRRFPYASLEVQDIKGILSQDIPVGGVGRGRLIGRFHILHQDRPVSIAVKILRFGETSWGVLPVSTLQMSVAALGFGEERKELNEVTRIYFGDVVQVTFRLEIEGT